MAKVRVLVIDDMPLARQVVAAALGQDPSIEVVGVAGEARFAREKLDRLSVDVVTLDLEMPGIDGLSFLRALLAVRRMPVVVVSALAPHGSELALRALELGAVDVLEKPARALTEVGEEFARKLAAKVKAAARANVRVRRPLSARHDAAAPAGLARASGHAEPVILLGASTGGCAALTEILSSLPSDAPPVLCVMHIAAGFSTSFAERLNAMGRLRVREARTGDVLETGCGYVAPGGQHTIIVGGRTPRLQVSSAPPVDFHRPSINLAFRSAAAALGHRALAAVLTGMGADGAEGLRAVRDAGGFTLAQDEATSVIYGMPREAARRGGAQAIAPLETIADILLSEVHRRRQP